MARAQRRLVVTGVVLALLVLAAGGRAVAFYVDYLWFGEVGYPQVFLTALWAGVGTFLAGCAVFLALFVPNALLALALARRLVRRVPVHLVDPPFRGPRGLGIDLGGLGGLGGLRPSEGERPRPL